MTQLARRWDILVQSIQPSTKTCSEPRIIIMSACGTKVAVRLQQSAKKSADGNVDLPRLRLADMHKNRTTRMLCNRARSPGNFR